MTDDEPRLGLHEADAAEAECSVCVAVHVRPLVHNELADGCQPCVYVNPGQPQVSAGGQSFTFDHVYSEDGVPATRLYQQCVLPLVQGLFKGYNATVFAYGQTGSGKTYTMGSAFTPDTQRGVIPCAMETLFAHLQQSQDTVCTVRVGFVEIHQEQIRDLMVLDSPLTAKEQSGIHIREVAGGGIMLAGATERVVTSEQEMSDVLRRGTLMRATASTEMNKRSSRSHAIFTITLEQRKAKVQGAQSRKRCRPVSTVASLVNAAVSSAEDISDESDVSGATSDDEDADAMPEDYLCAKLHLVDLAGSERVKRTKAQGQRLREGITINKGLLALGNVISALSEGKPHVPYRDSKLTRMLQDSLGGNSRTLMIACVSPADVNMEETVNTLRYANRARNIRNKPVINRDPIAAEILHLRQQLAAARGELNALRRRVSANGSGDQAARVLCLDPAEGPEALTVAWEELQQANSVLELQNARLKVELETARQEAAHAHRHKVEAQAQRDALRMKLQKQQPAAVGPAQEVAAVDANVHAEDDDFDVVQQHLQRISALELENKRLRQLSRLGGSLMSHSNSTAAGPFLTVPGTPRSPVLGSVPIDNSPVLQHVDALSVADDLDDKLVVEEQAFRLQQEAVQLQLDKLQRALESKEDQMARLRQGGGQMASLRQHYDKVLKELAAERTALDKERKDLLSRLQALQHASQDERSRLERKYKEQLECMDAKLKDLQRREKKFKEMERLKARSEEVSRRLQNEIMALKQQRVSLQRQMEKASKEYRQRKCSDGREILQLRAQDRKKSAYILKMQALNAKHEAVLRRKCEEGEAAKRRLKEINILRESAQAQRDASRPSTGSSAASLQVECQPNHGAPLLRDEKARKDWVERELDMCCAYLDLRRVIEGERAMRTDAMRKLKDVEKQLATMSVPTGSQMNLSPVVTAQPRDEDVLKARKQELEEAVAAYSRQINDLQQQLVKARTEEEQRTSGAADARRWNQLRTIVEARAMLKTVFRIASAHKATAYEAGTEATELRERCEFLTFELDIARQDAALRMEKIAKSALKMALASSCGNTPRARAMGHDSPSAENDDPDVREVLAGVINFANSEQAAPSNDLVATTAAAAVELAEGDEESVSEDDDQDSASSSSSDAAERDNWTPSKATPALVRRASKNHRHSAVGRQSGAIEADSSAESDVPFEQQGRRRSGAGTRTAAHASQEAQILDTINNMRSGRGEAPYTKLTNDVLKNELKYKVIRGRQWTATVRQENKRDRRKTRAELLKDYCDIMEEQGGNNAVLQVQGQSIPVRSAPAQAEHAVQHIISSATVPPTSHPILGQSSDLSMVTARQSLPGTHRSSHSSGAAMQSASSAMLDEVADPGRRSSDLGNGVWPIASTSGALKTAVMKEVTAPTLLELANADTVPAADAVSWQQNSAAAQILSGSWQSDGHFDGLPPRLPLNRASLSLGRHNSRSTSQLATELANGEPGSSLPARFEDTEKWSQDIAQSQSVIVRKLSEMRLKGSRFNMGTSTRGSTGAGATSTPPGPFPSASPTKLDEGTPELLSTPTGARADGPSWCGKPLTRAASSLSDTMAAPLGSLPISDALARAAAAVTPPLLTPGSVKALACAYSSLTEMASPSMRGRLQRTKSNLSTSAPGSGTVTPTTMSSVSPRMPSAVPLQSSTVREVPRQLGDQGSGPVVAPSTQTTRYLENARASRQRMEAYRKAQQQRMHRSAPSSPARSGGK